MWSTNLINALCVCNVERKMDFLSGLLNQNGVGSSADLEWDETQFASPQEDWFGLMMVNLT